MATPDDDINITDQDSLSAEEQKQLADMEAADKTGATEGTEPVVPAAVVPKTPKEKKGAAAAPKTEGAEAEAAAAEGDKGKGEDSKTVPLAALHESRAEIKRLRDERVADAERFSTLEKRTNLILEKLVPKEPEVKAEVVPDFETDPAGWIAGTMKATGKQLADVEKELSQLRTEKAQNAEKDKNLGVIRGVMDYAIGKENEFKAVTPDYDEASAFLVQSRADELAEMGKTPDQIQQIIQLEKLSIAQDCQASGKNPAEVVYNIAKRRGFVKKAPADEGKTSSATGAEKLEAARQGTEQSASLSGTRGNAPSPLTAQRLLEMSEAEFAKAIMTPEGRALMGS